MTYTPPRAPRQRQAEALAKMQGKEAFALFMAMRTGKTKVILDDYGRLEDAGEVKNLAIIGPGGCYDVWPREAAIDLAPGLRERMAVHLWESKNKSRRQIALRHEFMSADPARPRMLVMNVEALSSVQEARNMARRFLTLAPAMAVISESTIIKGTSKRTKFVNNELSPLAAYRRIECGLPAPRDPMDLYHQMMFLDWRILGFQNYYAFRARFADLQPQFFGGRRFMAVKGYHDLDHLQKLIEPWSYRCRLEDCYDVPESEYVARHVELTPEQRRIYDSMKAYATAQLSATEHVTATIVISQILRLHQILCGHTVDEGGRVHAIPENRTASLLELLREYDGKAIVWCSYDYDVQKVAQTLAKEFGSGSVSRFWGGNRPTREREEAEFKTDPARRWMVATPAAGGKGREWSVADLVVYYSNSDNLEFRDQSEQRPQAVGKRQHVTYVDLMVPGTVDEKIVAALKAKIDLASMVVGDELRKWLI